MMVYVSACYAVCRQDRGFCSLRHEIRFRHGGRVVRECVRAKTWDRRAASEALDLLERCYEVKRKNVKFCQQ